MGTQNSSGFQTFTATAAAIGEGIRVKVDSNGLISAAGAAEIAIGVTTEAVASSGSGTVKLFSAPGTYSVVAAKSIARGTHLYPAASGKVSDTGTTKIPLAALEAATADGDIIEAAPVQLGA